MTDAPIDRLLEALQEQGYMVRARSGYWSAQCPAHDDREPSLSIKVGDRQPVLLKCQAGCHPDEVITKLGFTWPELCKPPEDADPRAAEWTPAGPATAVYDYRDENGTLLFQVLRTAGKKFRQRRPDPTGKHGWKWNLDGVRRVPYRLPELLAAITAGTPVFIAEGEKDVESLVRHGVTATCNPGGVGGGWRPEYSDHFKAADVTIIADRDEDEKGRKHAAKVHTALTAVARSVRIVEAAEGKDATDHLNSGRRISDFVPVETRPTNPNNQGASHNARQQGGSGISGTRIQDPEWEDPIPLAARALPPFPVDRLGKLGEFITAAAAALQVPPDLVVCACLATVSICTGGRVEVRIKPGWTESTALYLSALADSSEKKTPVLNLAAQPLREAETKLIELARPIVEAKAQDIRITEGQMARAEQKAASDKPGNALVDARTAREKLIQLGEAPALPRLLVRDATLEAIAKVMATQNGRIGTLASEGGLLKVAAGLYSGNGQANTDLLLEAFSGGPYSIDRAGRGAARMASTFLTIGLIVQPGVLAGVEKKNPEFRENGLLGRFLYFLPPASDSDTFASPDIPIEVYNHYDARIRDLIAVRWGTDERVGLQLSDDARALFSKYYDAFAQRRKPGGDLYDIADWAGKFRGQLARIAACLTLYENSAATHISESCLDNVLGMAPYFIAHARAAFDLMGRNQEGRLKPLRDLLGWLRARDKPGEKFTARDAWQALKGRRWAESMEDMTAALDALEDHGWIARVPPPDTPGRRGRKRSPEYEVHPWVADPPKRSAGHTANGGGES